MVSNSKTISVVINVRLHSSRIERKMSRGFGGTTLLDVALSKYADLKVNKWLAICESEREIVDICKKYESEYHIIFRSEESVKKGRADQRVSFKHYDDIPTSHILWINPCAPFLRVETINEALAFFLENDFPTMTSIKPLKNLVFDDSFSPINKTSSAVSSQGNSDLYEMAHLFHIFDRETFKNRGFFWDYSQNNPRCYLVQSPKECLDVDELFDFELCEALYS